MSHCKTQLQPPWEFLLSASRNSLQSFELSRLSHAANLRKEIGQLLDSYVEENSAAMLARLLMEQREHRQPLLCPIISWRIRALCRTKFAADPDAWVGLRGSYPALTPVCEHF